MFNDMVQVLDLAHSDFRAMRGVAAFDRRPVGATFVDRGRFRHAVMTDGFVQETQRRLCDPAWQSAGNPPWRRLDQPRDRDISRRVRLTLT